MKLSEKKDRKWLLGNEKIGPLLFKLSAPAIVGMAVQALYNLVDTFFVGQGVGVLAIGGIAISFPVQILIMALVQTIGIGSASLISRALGEGNQKRAEKALGNVVTLTFFIGLIMAILGIILIDELVALFGAADEIAGYTRDYLSIILLGTVFLSYAMSHNNIVRSEGNARVAMITMIISGFLNMALDALFIFGFGWGVKGAALATVLSQVSTAAYLLFYFFSGKSLIRYCWKALKPDRSVIREIFAVGSPAFVRMGAGSIAIVILNHSLTHYGGPIAVAVFGVIHRLVMFTWLPMFGIVQGMQPIIGFNYGAKQIARVKETLKIGITASCLWSTGVFFLLMFAPEALLSLFTSGDSTEYLRIGTDAMRKIIIIYPLVGFMINISGFFQSIGKAFPAVILALSRQVLLLIPAILFLPLYLGLDGVWLSFPVADSITLVIGTFLFFREMKNLGKHPERTAAEKKFHPETEPTFID